MAFQHWRRQTYVIDHEGQLHCREPPHLKSYTLYTLWQPSDSNVRQPYIIQEKSHQSIQQALAYGDASVWSHLPD